MPATTIAPRPLYWSFPGAETLFEVCTIRISPRVRGTDRQLVRVLAARGEDLVGHPSWALGSVDTVVQVEVVVGLFDDAVAVGPALGAVEVAEQPRDRIAPQTRQLPSRCWRVSSGISGELGWRTPGPSRRTGLNATASPARRTPDPRGFERRGQGRPARCPGPAGGTSVCVRDRLRWSHRRRRTPRAG